MTTKPQRTLTVSRKYSLGLPVLAVSLLTGALLAACAPEMDPVSLVERTRVIGARVEVEGAPERATPRPGETAEVRWLITAPGTMPPLGWAFVVCPGATAGSEIACTGEPLAVFQGEGPPVVKLPIPARAQLGDLRTLALVGRVCTDSRPVLDPGSTNPRCAMDADGTTAAMTLSLEVDEPGNRNPSFAGAALQFAGQPWSAAAETPPGADPITVCGGLPQVKAGSKEHRIRIEAGAMERERYVAIEGDPPAPKDRREWLQISHFTTAGELDQAFSAIEAEDDRTEPYVEMKWDAPEAAKVPAGGMVVRFTFVVRDMRGGVDWTSRSVCVVP